MAQMDLDRFGLRGAIAFEIGAGLRQKDKIRTAKLRASNRKGRGCRWQSRQEGQEAKSRKNDGEEPNLILAEEPAYAQDDNDEGVDQERQPDAPAFYNFSTDFEKRSDALMESQARNGPPFIVVANEFENPLQRMAGGSSRARWGAFLLFHL
jgi:hypothetical protein